MMFKSIQAYFPTENEAEAVKALLVSYETKMIEVSRLSNTESNVGIPINVPYSGTVGIVSPMGGIGDGLNSGNIIDTTDHYPEHSGSDKDSQYVLSAKVKEEDYDAIIEVIQHNKGKL